MPLEQRTKLGKKVPEKYLHGLRAKGKFGSIQAMKREIDFFSGKRQYKQNWDADFLQGKRIRTRLGKATKVFRERSETRAKLIGTALERKAKISGIPLGILRRVFARGMQAWNTGHRPGVAQYQWAMGRVNSFITGVGGSRRADKDLWEKAKRVSLNK